MKNIVFTPDSGLIQVSGHQIIRINLKKNIVLIKKINEVFFL
jgi:hypothetical protein